MKGYICLLYTSMEQLLAQGPFYDLPDRLVDAALSLIHIFTPSSVLT